jgi:hypothetical protein
MEKHKNDHHDQKSQKNIWQKKTSTAFAISIVILAAIAGGLYMLKGSGEYATSWSTKKDARDKSRVSIPVVISESSIPPEGPPTNLTISPESVELLAGTTTEFVASATGAERFDWYRTQVSRLDDCPMMNNAGDEVIHDGGVSQRYSAPVDMNVKYCISVYASNSVADGGAWAGPVIATIVLTEETLGAPTNLRLNPHPTAEIQEGATQAFVANSEGGVRYDWYDLELPEGEECPSAANGAGYNPRKDAGQLQSYGPPSSSDMVRCVQVWASNSSPDGGDWAGPVTTRVSLASNGGPPVGLTITPEGAELYVNTYQSFVANAVGALRYDWYHLDIPVNDECPLMYTENKIQHGGVSEHYGPPMDTDTKRCVAVYASNRVEDGGDWTGPAIATVYLVEEPGGAPTNLRVNPTTANIQAGATQVFIASSDGGARYDWYDKVVRLQTTEEVTKDAIAPRTTCPAVDPANNYSGYNRQVNAGQAMSYGPPADTNTMRCVVVYASDQVEPGGNWAEPVTAKVFLATAGGPPQNLTISPEGAELEEGEIQEFVANATGALRYDWYYSDVPFNDPCPSLYTENKIQNGGISEQYGPPADADTKRCVAVYASTSVEDGGQWTGPAEAMVYLVEPNGAPTNLTITPEVAWSPAGSPQTFHISANGAQRYDVYDKLVNITEELCPVVDPANNYSGYNRQVDVNTTVTFNPPPSSSQMRCVVAYASNQVAPGGSWAGPVNAVLYLDELVSVSSIAEM